jgi:hypothetical protein
MYILLINFFYYRKYFVHNRPSVEQFTTQHTTELSDGQARCVNSAFLMSRLYINTVTEIIANMYMQNILSVG